MRRASRKSWIPSSCLRTCSPSTISATPCGAFTEMKYRLVHRTKYTYEGAVTVSHHLARLAPRTLPGQRCPWHEMEIHPVPVGRGVHVDSFGNVNAYFEIEGKHE
ncbi:MAG: hypothetical protein EOO77_21645, partial [Oxalobacteraceae bacterium]